GSVCGQNPRQPAAVLPSTSIRQPDAFPFAVSVLGMSCAAPTFGSPACIPRTLGDERLALQVGWSARLSAERSATAAAVITAAPRNTGYIVLKTTFSAT